MLFHYLVMLRCGRAYTNLRMLFRYLVMLRWLDIIAALVVRFGVSHPSGSRSRDSKLLSRTMRSADLRLVVTNIDGAGDFDGQNSGHDYYGVSARAPHSALCVFEEETLHVYCPESSNHSPFE